MRPSPRRSRTRRGFTLVELMVVVTIVAVLAVVGIRVLRNHVFGSKSAEAFAMIQSIRAAEERWKSENLTYLKVSSAATDQGSAPWYPANPISAARAVRSFHVAVGQHGDEANWKALNPALIGNVEFGYLAHAGPPGTAMQRLVVTPAGGASPTLSNPGGDHWYVIQAVADADGDGVPAYFAATSLKGDVYAQNQGE